MNSRMGPRFPLLALVTVSLVAASWFATFGGAPGAFGGQAAAVSASDKPYLVEWVYKVKWGYTEEFWQLFKKYQFATLNREKELGYVTSYTVYRPGFHMGEDSRYEYRIVIAYKNISSSTHGSEVEKQLFPDQATMKREENRRWELTVAHYDVPIRVVDPNGDGTD
jgi:hypothetical protein